MTDAERHLFTQTVVRRLGKHQTKLLQQTAADAEHIDILAAVHLSLAWLLLERFDGPALAAEHFSRLASQAAGQGAPLG